MKCACFLLLLFWVAILGSAPVAANSSDKKTEVAQIEVACGLKRGTIRSSGNGFVIGQSPNETNDQYRCALARLDKHALDEPGLAPPAGSGPVPKPLFSRDDYPFEAIKNGWEGSVVADLTVSSEGRVIGCTVLQSSGHPVLDQKTCDVLRTRATFIPAHDANGRVVESHVRTPPITWAL
jgi:TonB family protein